MDNAVILWLMVFAIAASIFFGVAVVITIKGFADLLALLRGAGRRDGNNSPSARGEGFDE